MQMYKGIYRETETGQDVEFELEAKSVADAAFKMGLVLGEEIGVIHKGERVEEDKMPWLVDILVVIR